MTGKQISLIYFYLVSAASLALIVIGIFSIVNFSLNSLYYEKYPLRYFGEDCEYDPYRYQPKGPYPAEITPNSTPSAEEREEAKRICEKRAGDERLRIKVDDIKNALTFTIVGTVLFLIHFPIARRLSGEKS